MALPVVFHDLVDVSLCETGGGADRVSHVEVLPALERLREPIENAIAGLGARGLSFVAIRARVLESVESVLRKHPGYYLESISPKMKIIIGLLNRSQ